MIVTRFAPSPTGYLHVGGARTALYAWLHARRHDGKFILRIEDTDRERSDPAMVDRILESLRWLGIDWDEGPFFQSERSALYDEYIARLLEHSLAYECFCTPEELEERRKAAAGEMDAFRYDGRCAGLTRDECEKRKAGGSRAAVRLRMPGEESTVVPDLIRGNVVFEASVLDDLVIRKSDGMPTFHFAVALDDALMGVTDVIRGDDHLSNTPKQIRILEALRKATGDPKFEIPRYEHLPLILGSDGKRFSKRHGATAVGEFRERGFLPDALVNFLALLGWSPGDDREILSRGELVQLFDFKRVLRKGAVFDEQKLLWMNGKYLAATPIAEVRGAIKSELDEFAVTTERLKGWGVPLSLESWLDTVVAYGRDRSSLISEIIGHIRYFLVDGVSIDQEAAEKHLRGDHLRERLEIGLAAIEATEPWTIETLEKTIRDGAEARGFKPPKIMHPLRVATTGRMLSPGLFETIFYIGRRRAAARIREVLGTIPSL